MRLHVGRGRVARERSVPFAMLIVWLPTGRNTRRTWARAAHRAPGMAQDTTGWVDTPGWRLPGDVTTGLGTTHGGLVVVVGCVVGGVVATVGGSVGGAVAGGTEGGV